MNFQTTFDTQISILIKKNYPQAANVTKEKFLELVNPLRQFLPEQSEFQVDIEHGELSFVIVIKSQLVPTEVAMSLIERSGKTGITKLFPHQSTDFQAVAGEVIPENKAYLLLDIDRGKENINLPPNEAMKIIRAASRFPLTIDEGVAILTQYPDFLQKNNCFSLLASRHQRDQRVPAIWINTLQHPNLGWCWDGNPHTWLGSASASKRVA